MFSGNAGGQRVCQREAGIVITLICKMRAGVIPGPDAIGAGESLAVLALIGQVACLCDDEGAAAKAEDRAGRKRSWLI